MQRQKMHMNVKQLRIGDLAKELKVKKFVIRFWEKEFDIKSDRSQGGQRSYTTEDLRIFQHIKNLLYDQGFTIAGAKKQLQEIKARGEINIEPEIIASQKDEKNITGAQYAYPEDCKIDTEESNNDDDDIQSVSDADIAAVLQLEPQEKSHTPMHHDHVCPERLTPATVVPCTCSGIAEKIKPIKEQLQSIKDRLDRLPITR